MKLQDYEPVHDAKRTPGGDVITKCGLRFKQGNEKQENWLTHRVNCRRCLRATRWP
ncbi:hypothetical protein HUW46_09553 (plasmid) [Amycolatopsis sp. CA-230715]|nr:hypothetical protein HUW46_09553 [Amycolatopsis sp. CA-230715]